MKALILALLLVGACSDKSGGAVTKPSKNRASAHDDCTVAVDKLIAMLKRKGERGIDPSQREDLVEQCHMQPAHPTTKCVAGARDDAAVEACMQAPQGEPHDQLAHMTQQLRMYHFVHETFVDMKVGLTPARSCCEFPNKKCPPEAAPDELWTSVMQLDLSKERTFQYRFESTRKKAIIEAIGDRDCDGVTVTYRRELEMRDDGNMHITVLDPPEGKD